nr:phage tail tape measure protein [Tianweitania sediminis]
MVGRIAAIGGAYIGATEGIKATVGGALEFESAMADVRKVLDVNDEQFANIRRQITGMSRELPVAASGIAEIYANAAQSNVPLAELGKFAEMVAKVSVAWDTTQGETSSALAEIKTQLGMGVDDIGLYADALNHLSNNTAAKAPKLVEFSRVVAATGELYGFGAQQTLAFGGAMIAAGAQSEVAATSFRNMGRALTMGARATKSQRQAYSRLGIDSVKTAKSMQKNALKTTLDVIDKIQQLPEWERVSIASALFGDEARALMPIINNATELRRQLDMVGDRTNYAGSAFKEYVTRAGTVGNVLEILQNKFADSFRSVGDSMLPSIREAALGIGDILDSLGERATPLTQMTAAFKGFMNGLGYDGSIRQMVNELGNLTFGPADGSANADKIGAIFVRFKEWGANIREFNAAVRDNPIAGFLAEMAGYGFQFVLAATGIGILAAAIGKLAGALYFLSGAKAAVAILKSLSGMTGLSDVLKGDSKDAKGAKGGNKVSGGGIAGALAVLRSAGAWAGLLLSQGSTKDNDYTNASAEERQRMRDQAAANARKFTPLESTGRAHLSTNDGGRARSMDSWLDGPPKPPGPTSSVMPDPLSALRNMTLRTQPTGVQQVQVTNPVRPNVTISMPVTIHEAAAPATVMNQLGAAVREATESNYGDGGL